MCFHTRDAVSREDSSFTFEMPGNRLRNAAGKVALASCEFPMVQWTVEESWNRFYMNEGIFITSENNTLEMDIGDKQHTVHVPLRINPIKSSHAGRVVTKHPHGLRAYHGHMSLLGSHLGDVRLETVKVISDTEFMASSAPIDAKYLHVPTLSGPTVLAEILTQKLREGKVHVAFEPKEDVFRFTCYVDHSPCRIHVQNTILAVQCGLSTVLQTTSQHTFVLPSQPTSFWDYVEMPLGFYSPCHRPMCTGPPLRFTSELEAAVNRLYFPLGAQKDYNGITPHLIIFTDPDGHLLTCPIPCGRYTPLQLCAHLETEMTNAASETAPGTSFAVGYEEERFRVSCERRVRGSVVHPVAFELLFHHPLSIDGARLGFSNQPHCGSSCYIASERTKCAKAFGKHVGNLIRVGEIGCQKRFRFHSTHPPPMIGVVATTTDQGCLEVRTHINKFPFAHGLQPGDIVHISASNSTPVVTLDEKSTSLREMEAKGTSARIPQLCSCVVAAGTTDPCVLRFFPPASCDGLSEQHTAIHIHCEVEPWNMAFCKPKSLQAHMLGFPPKVVEWGVDGSVTDDIGKRIPPFDAPFTHSLDHPDYILMTFSESSGALLEHNFNGQNKQVFCKLSLYPLFREERMLPRDTTLLNSQVSKFTLSFWNPDMQTPYQFHGAQFSFSLSFIGTN